MEGMLTRRFLLGRGHRIATQEPSSEIRSSIEFAYVVPIRWGCWRRCNLVQIGHGKATTARRGELEAGPDSKAAAGPVARCYALGTARLALEQP